MTKMLPILLHTLNETYFPLKKIVSNQPRQEKKRQYMLLRKCQYLKDLLILKIMFLVFLSFVTPLYFMLIWSFLYFFMSKKAMWNFSHCSLLYLFNSCFIQSCFGSFLGCIFFWFSNSCSKRNTINTNRNCKLSIVWRSFNIV